jgi:transcriptional regulator GlxA family with amidase domain
MHAHMGEPITITELAHAAGLPYRDFTDMFRAAMGTSAMVYYRQLRMAGVHADLAAADPARTTVTDIALKWGFTHHSWFSHAYYRAWGEYPSQTLRRPPGDLAAARRIRDRVGVRAHRPPRPTQPDSGNDAVA